MIKVRSLAYYLCMKNDILYINLVSTCFVLSVCSLGLYRIGEKHKTIFTKRRESIMQCEYRFSVKIVIETVL